MLEGRLSFIFQTIVSVVDYHLSLNTCFYILFNHLLHLFHFLAKIASKFLSLLNFFPRKGLVFSKKFLLAHQSHFIVILNDFVFQRKQWLILFEPPNHSNEMLVLLAEVCHLLLYHANRWYYPLVQLFIVFRQCCLP